MKAARQIDRTFYDVSVQFVKCIKIYNAEEISRHERPFPTSQLQVPKLQESIRAAILHRSFLKDME